MKQEPNPFARTVAMLLAAAALPLTPLAAQETQPPADTPAAQTPAPTPAEPSAPEPAADPAPVQVQTTAPPTEAAATPAAEPRAATPARTAARRTTRVTTTTARAPSVAPAPAPAPALPAADLAPLPAPEAVTPSVPAPEVLPETPAAPEPATQAQPGGGGSMLPWLLAGLLLVGALAFLALRRRRRAGTEVYDDVYEDRPVATPVAETAPIAPVAAAIPVAAAAAIPVGEPRIEFRMRPIRAGVGEADARVDFHLTVDNKGSAPAEDLRISTWMLASGSSEMERALIEPRDHADTPPLTIDAGQARTMEASVALPTAEVEGDALLPVVVADARYRLPDGSEGRTSASFAVGVPVEGELAHFDVENPSGLHEGVEARPVG